MAVGREGAVAIPAGARRIDLGDVTLLPGFIDAHTHIIGRPLGDPGADDAGVRDFDSFGAILGVANAQKTLMAGFTTIRNVGSSNMPIAQTGGTYAPGGATGGIATSTINGNYTLGPGGTLLIDLANNGTSDVLDVNGLAALSGLLALDAPTTALIPTPASYGAG